MSLTDVPVTRARSALPAVIAAAQHEPVALSRRGRRVAVLVSAEWWERAEQALEDRADIGAFDAAVAEGGENLPWEQVRRELVWQPNFTSVR